jgi:hypothetical protein
VAVEGRGAQAHLARQLFDPQWLVEVVLQPVEGPSDLEPDGEDLLAQLRRNVDMLQSRKNTQNVVAGSEVELNGRDVLLAELQLGIDDLTHGASNDEVYENSFRCYL